MQNGLFQIPLSSLYRTRVVICIGHDILCGSAPTLHVVPTTPLVLFPTEIILQTPQWTGRGLEEPGAKETPKEASEVTSCSV